MTENNQQSDPTIDASIVDDKDKAVEDEIKKTANSIELQTKALDRLKTIKTGKRKILDILRKNSEMMDKKLMEQLNERYNDFVRQEAEILELLKRTTGLPIASVDPNKMKNDPEAQEMMSEIVEINSKLAKLRARNIELEKEAASKDLKAAIEQRDALSKRVQNIQQNNIQKKQLLCKLMFENPDLIKNKQKNKVSPNFEACMEAVQNTPGTSAEYDEIVKRLEQIKSRRNRMNDLCERLSQATSSQKMDDAYHSALQRLEKLSSLRKALEEANQKDGEMTEKEEQKLDPEAQTTRPVLTSTTSVQLVNDSDEEEDENDDQKSTDKISTEESKKAAALSQLNSVRGKLEKQRTLERVLYFVEARSGDKLEEEANATVLEKEICVILDQIIPWLKKHEDEKANIDLLFELRQLVVRASNDTCFPSGISTNLFESQLVTILDDALSQFYDKFFKESHTAIITEISEILYNEIAFFKLMNDIDNISVDDD
uniref:Pericentriolar material 1 protein C-terminal domain-containing protein n=1 Tax=Panagrolaimus sp. JU765 TaxID=591449 RepID=A0AC34QFA9_9BILA